MEDLEGVPAIFYSLFWQTKAMGFFKRILEGVNVEYLRVLIFFKDYKPGALILLDAKEGDFKITPIENPKDIEYDGAVFGEMKYILNLIRGHILSRGFWYLITRKIRLKGIKSLLQFLKVIRKVAS